MKQKIFVIGGTGYLGYHLCRELVAKDYLVTALSFDNVPAGFLPDEVKIIKGDVNELSDTELAEMMAGHWGFVFAAGVDDRVIPKAPAYPFFYEGNVKSIKRLLKIAKSQQIVKAVVLNSYFAYFNRLWPEMHLAEKHPYVRSRKEQQEMAFAIGGEDMPVAIIELPYIVGVTPTKGSLWNPLVKYANYKGKRKFYTAGGTAVTSVRNVGLALANALEKTEKNTIYQVVDVNMSWAEWLQSLVKDQNKKLQVITIPKFILKIVAFFVHLLHKLQGKEAGLEIVSFIDLQTKETFMPIKESNERLGYLKYDIKEDFRDTVKLCLNT